MMELKRLTTDNPEKNIEVLLNYAYAEDGWVKLRAAGGEEEVDLCDYIEQQRRELGFDCGVFSTDIRDGACMECDCVLSLLNIVAIQAAELRGKLKHYEDMEEQGRLVVLPCGSDAELVKDGHIFKADHWNHALTAFRENPATRSGRQVALFSIENAEQALKGGAE